MKKVTMFFSILVLTSISYGQQIQTSSKSQAPIRSAQNPLQLLMAHFTNSVLPHKTGNTSEIKFFPICEFKTNVGGVPNNLFAMCGYMVDNQRKLALYIQDAQAEGICHKNESGICDLILLDENQININKYYELKARAKEIIRTKGVTLQTIENIEYTVADNVVLSYKILENKQTVIALRVNNVEFPMNAMILKKLEAFLAYKQN